MQCKRFKSETEVVLVLPVKNIKSATKLTVVAHGLTFLLTDSAPSVSSAGQSVDPSTHMQGNEQHGNERICAEITARPLVHIMVMLLNTVSRCEKTRADAPFGQTCLIRLFECVCLRHGFPDGCSVPPTLSFVSHAVPFMHFCQWRCWMCNGSFDLCQLSLMCSTHCLFSAWPSPSAHNQVYSK